MKATIRFLLFISVLVAVALPTAFASADTLCSSVKCPKEDVFPAKTQIESTAEGPVKFTGFMDIVTCESSSATYELTQNTVGAPGAPILVTPKAETFSGCTSAFLGSCSRLVATKFASGAEWQAHEESTGNGFVATVPAASILEFEYQCGPYLVCKYAASEYGIHEFLGGAPASEVWEKHFHWVSGYGYCPSGLMAEGARTFSWPQSMYWVL